MHVWGSLRPNSTLWPPRTRAGPSLCAHAMYTCSFTINGSKALFRVMKGALNAACDDRPSATHELRLRPGRAARSAGIVWCDTSSSATRAERARADSINISSGCRLEHHSRRAARCWFQVTPECPTHGCGNRLTGIGYGASLRHAGGVLAV